MGLGVRPSPPGRLQRLLKFPIRSVPQDAGQALASYQRAAELGNFLRQSIPSSKGVHAGTKCAFHSPLDEATSPQHHCVSWFPSGSVASPVNRVDQHGGRIANTAGDSVLAEFPSVVDAVQAALEVQEALKTANETIPEDRSSGSLPHRSSCWRRASEGRRPLRRGYKCCRASPGHR